MECQHSRPDAPSPFHPDNDPDMSSTLRAIRGYYGTRIADVGPAMARRDARSDHDDLLPESGDGTMRIHAHAAVQAIFAVLGVICGLALTGAITAIILDLHDTEHTVSRGVLIWLVVSAIGLIFSTLILIITIFVFPKRNGQTFPPDALAYELGPVHGLTPSVPQAHSPSPRRQPSVSNNQTRDFAIGKSQNGTSQRHPQNTPGISTLHRTGPLATAAAEQHVIPSVDINGTRVHGMLALTQP